MPDSFKIDGEIVGTGADCVLLTGMPDGAAAPTRLIIAVTSDAGRALFGPGWQSPGGAYDQQAASAHMERSAAAKYARDGRASGYDVWLTSADLLDE